MTQNTCIKLIAGLSLAAAAAVFLLPPIPQDPAYHRFADTGTLLGVPNFWNVISNLPFIVVGILGLRALPAAPGKLPELNAQYALCFLGILCTGLGSAFYHWHPDNGTLIWDRLPMTLAFMAFLAVVIGEHIGCRLSNRLLWPLVAGGFASVIYWHWTEAHGRGDLRPYGLVQFLPLAIIPLILLLLPSRFGSARHYWLLLASYGVAKLLELSDHWINSTFVVIGGHPLKHLAAATGTNFLYRALLLRRLRNEEE